MERGTDHSFEGPVFNSQYPHDSLQPSVTPAHGYKISSPDLFGPYECTWYMDIHAGQNIYTHKTYKIKIKLNI